MTSLSPAPTIDHALAFANDLVLFGWASPKSEPVAATLVDVTGRRARLNISKFRNYARPDVIQAFGRDGADNELYGFVCAVELADLIGFAVYDDEVRITIETRDGSTASGSVRIQSASSD